MTVHVDVHLDVDRWNPECTEAVRVSRRGIADRWLTGDQCMTGRWGEDWGDPEAAASAIAVATRHGLDSELEAPTATVTETSYSDDDDPRWMVTFEVDA